MKNNNNKPCSYFAARDITDSIHEMYNFKEDTFYSDDGVIKKETWNAIEKYVFTKESRFLNRLLGLQSINKLNNQVNFNK